MINDGLSTGDTSNLSLTGNTAHDAALSDDGNVGDGIVLDSINNATLSATSCTATRSVASRRTAR